MCELGMFDYLSIYCVLMIILEGWEKETSKTVKFYF